MKLNTFLPLFLILLSAHAQADRKCDFKLSIPNITVLMSDNEQVVQQDFTIQKEEDSSRTLCNNYRVYFSKGQANSYQRRANGPGGTKLNYNFHQGINKVGILKDYGDAANANEYIQGSSSQRTAYSNRFFISLPGMASQNYPRSGTYVDQTQARIYGVNPSNSEHLLGDTESFSVRFIIPNKIDVSLVDEGGVFDVSATSKVLDFGNLEQNLEKGVDLRVVSNTCYKILLSSTNNGRLKHTNNETIAYLLRVNGQFTNLGNSSGSQIEIGSGDETSTSGDRYNLKFKINESTENKRSGQYQDIVLITAMAN